MKDIIWELVMMYMCKTPDITLTILKKIKLGSVFETDSDIVKLVELTPPTIRTSNKISKGH